MFICSEIVGRSRPELYSIRGLIARLLRVAILLCLPGLLEFGGGEGIDSLLYAII